MLTKQEALVAAERCRGNETIPPWPKGIGQDVFRDPALESEFLSVDNDEDWKADVRACELG